jgi:hypothetical protein
VTDVRIELAVAKSGAVRRALGVRLVLVAWTVSLAGCNCGPYDEQLRRIEEIARRADAGTVDAGAPPDAGSQDAGPRDGGTDAGGSNSGDAGGLDGGSDSGVADAGWLDGGPAVVDGGTVPVDGGAVTVDAGMTGTFDGGPCGLLGQPCDCCPGLGLCCVDDPARPDLYCSAAGSVPPLAVCVSFP